MNAKNVLPFPRKGASTEPFVEELLKLNAIPGTTVAYQTAAKLINEDVGSQRYRTITGAWRRRLLRERNIEVKARDGQFIFLTADQAQNQRRNDFVAIGRRQRRVRARLNAINPQELSSDERKHVHGVMQREMIAMQQVTRRANKAIKLPRPKAKDD